MTKSARSSDNGEDPLDPAAERVRRKLVRFAAINIGILFVAVIAVLGAIVYKTMTFGSERAEPAGTPVADNRPADAAILLPHGATIVSQSLSGTTLTLLVELDGGAQAFFFYNIAEHRMLERIPVKTDAQ